MLLISIKISFLSHSIAVRITLYWHQSAPLTKLKLKTTFLCFCSKFVWWTKMWYKLFFSRISFFITVIITVIMFWKLSNWFAKREKAFYNVYEYVKFSTTKSSQTGKWQTFFPTPNKCFLLNLSLLAAAHKLPEFLFPFPLCLQVLHGYIMNFQVLPGYIMNLEVLPRYILNLQVLQGDQKRLWWVIFLWRT